MRYKHSMSKNVLKDTFIKTNYEFEKTIASNMIDEIEEFKEFLNFIFEHKKNELIITRIIRTEDKELYSNVPLDFYECGVENGTYYYDDEDEGVIIEEDEGEAEDDDNSDVKFKKINWVEWQIEYDNTNYYDDFIINITPFLFKVITYHKDSKKNKEILHLFTSEFFDIWNIKLEEEILNKKKRKVPKILQNSYKLLGIDRKAKIKKLLGD